MNLNKKYCLRLTPSEYEKLLTQIRSRGFMSISNYVRHQLFDVHKGYEYRFIKTSTPQDLLDNILDAIAMVDMYGREVNRIARYVNARSELRKDGAPTKLGPIIQHMDRRYNKALKNADKCILKTIRKTMEFAIKHNIKYEK